MPEGIGPGQNEVQPEQPKKSEGFELKPNPENAEKVRFMQENSRSGAEQPWSTGRVISNEEAYAQIARAMEGLKVKVSPELYERVVQAGGKPDGDEFKTQVANELRQAIGDEAFNQFNADTTVSRPFTPFHREGMSPTDTRTHGEQVPYNPMDMYATKANREQWGAMLSIEDRMNTLITGLVQNVINDLAENPQTKDMTPEEIADKVWQGLTTLTISKDDIASRIQRLRNK